MKSLTDIEIKKIKTDFVRAIMPNKTFETKAEIKENLESYRSLYTIRNEIERVFVNQMITTSKNIPDELIGKWQGSKVGRKSKDDLGECQVCQTKFEDKNGQNIRILKDFNNTFLSPMRERKLELGQKHCPNVNCCEYNHVLGAK